MASLEVDTTRVSITGIDGSGKDSVTHEVLGHLAEEDGLVSAKLGRPSLMFNGEGYQLIYQRVTSTYNRLHLLAEQKRWSYGVAAINALYVLTQARKLEPTLLKKGVDVLTTVRDCRIDPAIHMDIYSPKSVAKAASLSGRIAMMQSLTGIERDAIFWFNTDPRVAYERIQATIALAENAGIRGSGDMHETPDILAGISSIYRPALEALQNHTATVVVEVDNSERTLPETVGVVTDAMRKLRAKEYEPGEWVKF